MAWAGPSSRSPVWCSDTVKGGPTAQNVNCTTVDPTKSGPEVALMQQAPTAQGAQPAASDGPPMGIVMPASYQKFTSQMELGKYLTAQYHIRTPEELSSCETCHR